MDIDLVSLLGKFDSDELEEISLDVSVPPILRMKVIQTLARDWEVFSLSEVQQSAALKAAFDCIEEFISGIDDNRADVAEIIYQGFVDQIAKRRFDLAPGYVIEFPILKQEWKWPVILDIPNGTKLGEQDFPAFREFSALKLFGYSVGKTGLKEGWTTQKRQEFLSDFMELDLPIVVNNLFGDEYGKPLSSTRLKKVADHIASLVRLALSQKYRDNAVAVSHWKSDLEFLRNVFYNGKGIKFHPWPSF